MAIWMQITRNYSNPDSINYKLAYLQEFLSENLGELAFENQVELARLGDTIIEGGYLRTTLIRARSIFAEHLNVNALSAISADIGEVTSGIITGATVRTSSGANRIQLDNSVLQAFLDNVKRVELDYDSLDFFNKDGEYSGCVMGFTYEEDNLPRFIVYSPNYIEITSREDINEMMPDVEARAIISKIAGMPAISWEIFNYSNSAMVYLTDTEMGILVDDVEIIGDFSVSGSKSAVVNTKDYGTRKMYALEAPENRFISYIEKTLEPGEHYIEIEPMFRQTISNYFVVPHIQNNAVVSILEKDDNGFKVLVEGKQAEVVFEVNGKRIGYENVYMEEVEHGTLEYKSDEKSVIKPADIFRQSRLQRLKGSRSSIGADISIY